MITTLKFGGTSVQDANAVRRLIKIVKSRPGKRLVVVSALSKVTDLLLAASDSAAGGQTQEIKAQLDALRARHQTLISELALSSETLAQVDLQFHSLEQFLCALSAVGEISPRSLDRIVAVGELCSSIIIADAFRVSDVPVSWLDARTVLKTDDHFTGAAVDFEQTSVLAKKEISARLNSAEVVVTGGFIGGTEIKGQLVTTTLGRGGSDYSAAILGAAIDSRKIEIWTDVNGILTTDPRMVPSAKLITRLSFDEAAELAYFGAKVLHPATIFPAVKKDIPVFVLNSMNPDRAGTEITRQPVDDQNVVKALACKRNITLLNIYSSRMLGASGFLNSVFEAFARHRVSIDLISTSEVNVSLTLDPKTDPESLSSVVREIEKFATVTLTSAMASVAAVGSGIRNAAGVGARIFGALRGYSIHMISMGSSEVNISLVVSDRDVVSVIEKLHKEFFDQNQNSEIFVDNA